MSATNSSRFQCPSSSKITAMRLLSFLFLSPLALVAVAEPAPPRINNNAAGDVFLPGPVIPDYKGPPNIEDTNHEFSLRHVMVHGTDRYPELLRRKDIFPHSLVVTDESSALLTRPSYSARARTRKLKRLSIRDKHTIEGYLLDHRLGISTSTTADAWRYDEVVQPDITDKDTVLSLARIAANAYVELHNTTEWMEVGTPYNHSSSFGWESDGIRGHVFADPDNSTVIIGLKGTSAAVFDGADTTTNDKINDNLLFSCCCARVSYFWSTVCDCFSGTAYTCNKICLKKELHAENRYYRASLQLYYNVTQMYPDAHIWVVGHSLGGALSSLLGQTYGLPVVAFQAPGEALAAERLGLPMPPGSSRQNAESGIYHFGHTADPIFMGACNGPTSACSIGGYAMESRCHSGQECVYDVVSDKGWRMGLGYHRIKGVIKDVIEAYPDVPGCNFDEDCVDCFNWKFVDGNETTTTTSTTKIPAPTTTSCATPGWWGCRDKTTTMVPTDSPTTTTTPATTTTTSSVTCTHYGWFGNCLDDKDKSKTKTTITTTPKPTSVPTTTTATSTTATCSHYGWFGQCLDATSTTSVVTPAPTPKMTGKEWDYVELR
ncbi:Alpha/Beta hydrolase protein [Pyronema omphalodes]|nr:Alpha/Beta hydrolase protein [Pyronema omphalodes]